jgi:hypothetical protein
MKTPEDLSVAPKRRGRGERPVEIESPRHLLLAIASFKEGCAEVADAGLYIYAEELMASGLLRRHGPPDDALFVVTALGLASARWGAVSVLSGGLDEPAWLRSFRARERRLARAGRLPKRGS